MKQKRTHPQRRRKTITMEVRREWVLTYRLQGLTDRQIAQRLKDQHGVTVSHVTVNSDWKAALATRRDENDEDWQNLRDIQNARYEYLISKLMPKVAVGDVSASNTVGRHIKGFRELNGLDRAVGTPEVPLTIQRVDDTDYDWSQLTDEDLERFAELEEKARIIPFPGTG